MSGSDLFNATATLLNHLESGEELLLPYAMCRIRDLLCERLSLLLPSIRKKKKSLGRIRDLSLPLHESSINTAPEPIATTMIQQPVLPGVAATEFLQPEEKCREKTDKDDRWTEKERRRSSSQQPFDGGRRRSRDRSDVESHRSAPVRRRPVPDEDDGWSRHRGGFRRSSRTPSHLDHGRVARRRRYVNYLQPQIGEWLRLEHHRWQ